MNRKKENGQRRAKVAPPKRRPSELTPPMSDKGRAIARRSPTTIWAGPDELRQFLVPIKSVDYDKENARVHDERNQRTIVESFQKNGQVQVLVVYEGRVVAGNARLEAANQLNWTHVAVLDVTGHFTSREQATAFALMDNKSAELATWDMDQVADLMKELPSEWRAFTGFSDAEIAPLLQNAASSTEPGKKSGGAPEMRTLSVTLEQYEVMERAVARLREKENDGAISMGRGLELVCGDYLSGA